MRFANWVAKVSLWATLLVAFLVALALWNEPNGYTRAYMMEGFMFFLIPPAAIWAIASISQLAVGRWKQAR